jgi:single-stranded DNA-binding protein
MIDGLIAGKLYGSATQHTGKSGQPYTTAKVRAAAGDGESLFVNVIAFSATAGTALMALGDGDAVALAGTLTPKAWTDRNGAARPGLDMVAAQVLTAYHVTKKRKAVSGQPPDTPARKAAAPAPGEDFGEDAGDLNF